MVGTAEVTDPRGGSGNSLLLVTEPVRGSGG
jgi:hypothetical protein